MSGKEYLSDILFFVHQRNGMAGCNTGSFRSQATAAQGNGLKLMLNGCLNFFRTEIAFGAYKNHCIRRFLINLLEQLLILFVTVCNKFLRNCSLLNKITK